MIRKPRLAALALMLALCVLASAAAATMHTEVNHPTLEMSVNVGYDGMITYGKAIPIRVVIRNSGEDFEGTLGVNAWISNKTYDRFETPVSLPAGAEREFVLAPTVYTRQDVFTAEITKDGEILCAVNAEPERLANPSAMLIGVLSTRPQNLNNLTIDRENDTLGRFELWQTVPLTPETFPEDSRLMNSFGMIVIDDVDPSVLNGVQRETLDRWLRGGRILLCGGGAAGARAIDYFSGYTGLRLEGITSTGSVAAALLRSVGRAETGEKADISVAKLTGADPLVRDLPSPSQSPASSASPTDQSASSSSPDQSPASSSSSSDQPAEAPGLIWRTAAGAGRIYTSAFEAGNPALNAMSLMHWYWQQLLVNNDSDIYNSVLYAGSEDQGDMATFAGSGVPVKAGTGMLPALLIAAGTPLLAALCWVGLKKTGRQKWMWLVLPFLSAVAVLALAVLSGGSEANRPLAVIAENLVQDAGGNLRSYRGISAATPEYGRHTYAAPGEKLRIQNYDYVDYDEESEAEKQEPTILRTCYITGGANALTAESATPWEIVNMTCEAESGVLGQVESAIWMEEDGFHAEITNGTEHRLTAGHVITNYGYVSVPDLDPGEKAEVALTYRTLADPLNPVYEDGGLYMNAGTDFYQIACAACGYVEVWDGSADRNPAAARVNMINTAASRLNREKNGTGYISTEATRFIYSAVPEALPPIDLSVDGRPVSRMTIFGQLTAEMNYLDVGRTGIVFRTAGMDTPIRVETDDNGLPGRDMKQTAVKSYYHALSETPTFRYDLSGLTGVKLEKLRLIMEEWYSSQAKPYALNAETGVWDEIRLNEDIPNPENYLDPKGNLYLQFRPDTQELYAEIPTPLIQLEGRADR